MNNHLVKKDRNILKNKIQSEAVQESTLHKDYFLEWATGVGKSAAALKIVLNHYKTDKTPWIIFCKETNHFKTWEDELANTDSFPEFKEFAEENIIQGMYCYDSAHKLIDTNYNIIFDEAHAVTDKRLESIITIKCNKRIYATATMPLDKIMMVRQYLSPRVPIKFNSIKMNKAIQLGLLPSPTINVINIDFDSFEAFKTEKSYEFVVTKGKKASHVHLHVDYSQLDSTLSAYKNVHITVKATAAEKYFHLCKQIDKYKRLYFTLGNDFYNIQWMQYGSQRKRFIAEIKTKFLQELVNNLTTQRFIAFTGSISQCEVIGDTSNIIHSKIGKKDRMEIIENFNTYKNSRLFCVNMLKESMNLSQLDFAIVMQLDNQTKSFIQMLGRSFRSESPVVYVFVMKGTQDEKYFKTAFGAISSEYVNKMDLHQGINHINNTFKDEKETNKST